MDFADFLRWERAAREGVYVKLLYFDMAGDIEAGILLSQIVYWHLPDRAGATRLRIARDGVMWLAKGRGDWWEETRLSARQVDAASSKLVRAGLIESHNWKFEQRVTPHYRIVPAEFVARWDYCLRHPPSNPAKPAEEGACAQGGNNGSVKPEITEPLNTNDESVKCELRIGDSLSYTDITTVTTNRGGIPARESPPLKQPLALVRGEESALLAALQSETGVALTGEQLAYYAHVAGRLLGQASAEEVMAAYRLKAQEKRTRGTWYRFEWLEKDLPNLLPLVRAPERSALGRAADAEAARFRRLAGRGENP